MDTAPAAAQTVTREVGPLSMRAAFRAGSVDEEKRTAELTWSTGARVLRGFCDRFWEELSLEKKHVRLDRLKSGRAPLLNSHNGYSLGGVIGVVQSARIENGEGIAVVRFAKAEDDPEADRIFRLVKDGIIGNVSVGYRVYRFEKIEDASDKIPVMRATDWEPTEISLVPMGADAGAGVRSADVGEATTPCVFVFPKERTMDEQTPATPPAPAEPTTTAKNDEATRAAEAATRAERERCTKIREVVRMAKLDGELADDLIGRGVSVNDARDVVLRKLADADAAIKTENHVRVEMGDSDDDKFMRAAQAAIFERSGASESILKAQECERGKRALAGISLDAGPVRSFKMADIARECLERRGIKTRGWDQGRIVREALVHRAGMNTTSDFGVLLESAMHKTLLAGYATQPSTWRRFCGIKSVSDLRTHNFYRNGSFGTLDDVNEHGEFKNKAIPDGEKVTLSVGKKGNIIGLTSEAIVNDDLSAFSDLAARFGAMAERSIEVAVYALLAENSGLGPTQGDSSPFFDGTARGNVGTGAAISVESLEADSLLMAEQTDPSGNDYLDLRPSVLLVPHGLAGTAKVINEAQFDPDTANKLQRPNKSRGLFSDIVGTPRITGTRRYLFADPGIAPAIVVAFLEGQQAPVLDSKEGWRVDGIEWRIRHAFRAVAFDYRAAVTNAGTGG